MNEAIEAAINEYIARVNDAVETGCEMALLRRVGVLLIHHPDGSVTVGPSADVPYGTIHEY